MRYAIVNGEGIIVTVVEWDGVPQTTDEETGIVSGWSPPDGTTAHAYPDGPISAGWQWNDGSPIDPEASPP